MAELKLRDRLRCPACRGNLDKQDADLSCARCGGRYPSVDGVPILINESNSVFRIDDFVRHRSTYFDRDDLSPSWRDKLARLLYDNSIDLKTPELIGRFTRLATEQTSIPNILVIGSGIDSGSLHSLGDSKVNLLLTDVALHSNVTIVCDAHDIPFEDETFHGVIAQAVLEHVVNPFRCVDEIYRVLKQDGIVFSDTPFIQQVHGGRYDFTRFTHLGHRLLFRRFEEIESGASGGPGAALTWSWRYFLLSFARSRWSERILRVFAKVSSFWWKYLDRYLLERPGALDAASSTYFLGRKDLIARSDRELVEQYRTTPPPKP